MSIKQLLFTGSVWAGIIVGMPCTWAQDAGWYIGAGAGNSNVDQSAFAFKDDTAVKLFAGYNFNQHFALEGGYVDLGELHVDARPGALVALNGFQFVAVGIIPINERLSVFGKAGAYAWKADGGSAFNDHQGTAFTVGIGVTYGGKVAVRAEWERLDVDLFSVSVAFSPFRRR